MGPRKPQRGIVGRTGHREGQHLRGLGKKEDSTERCSEQEEPASLLLMRLSVHPPSIRPSVHSLRHLSTYLPNSLPTRPPTHPSDRSAGTEAARPAPRCRTRDGAKTRRGVPPRKQGEARAPSGVPLHLRLKEAPDAAAPSLWSLTGREEPGTALGG